MGKIPIEGIGWALAGAVSIIGGIAMYGGNHAKGSFYIDIGAVSIIIGIFAPKLRIRFEAIFRKNIS